MSKLFRLKSWYSIEQAAQRLSGTLQEPVSVQDVYHLCYEGRLKLSWQVPYRAAREVAPVTKLINWYGASDDDPTKTLWPLGNPETYEKIAWTWYFEPQRLHVETLDGIYRLDLEFDGGVKSWLLSLATGNPDYHKLVSFEGFFVWCSEGRLWKIVERFPLDLKSKERLPYFHPDNYYPSDELPNESELVILRTDLEAFELSLIEPLTQIGMPNKAATGMQDVHESERESLLKMVLGMAIAAYNYKPDASRNAATGEKKGSIYLDLDNAGLGMDADTIRKFIKEAEGRFKNILPKS
ncbi:hypothetical protein EVC37_25690 [Methylocaldum sp. BRCS4]|jgi:hypothetical protein|nr:hypothetical protein [Methylocaldum sp. BRCS4]